MTTVELLAIYGRLPDLLTQAHSLKESRDVYAVLQELEAAQDAKGEPYVRTMPVRSPPVPCSSGQHKVASMQHKIVVPASKQGATLSELDLHEARAHGAALPAEVGELLRTLAGR